MTIRQRAFLFSLALVCLPCFGAEKYAIDWRKTAPEILEKYRDLIRIDTSNPPGNETKAFDGEVLFTPKRAREHNHFASSSEPAGAGLKLRPNMH